MQKTAVARALAGLTLLGALVACDDSPELITRPDPNNAIFARYVALGNSITAGWQSGGINDSTQKESYAYLLAQQMGTTFNYPSFAAFGCPAPVGNFLTGTRIDSLVPAAQRQPCYLRNATAASPILNNVAVPYAYGRDLLGPASATDATIPTVPGNALWTFILGGKSQVAKALEADPTFVTVWVGNNETLLPASVGMLQPPAGTAPPVIPPTVWIPSYKAAIDSLVRGAKSLKGGVLIGAVQVTNAPRFFPADSLATNATFKSQFETLVGKPITLIGCGASGALVSIEIVNAIRAYTPINPPATSHPPIISCVKNTPVAPIGDIFILDQAELAQFAGVTAAYNAYVKAKADTIGFAYLDPNPLLAQLRAAGAVPVKPNFLSAKEPFGRYVSLDGAHPARPSHVLAANALIDVINAKYQTTIPKLANP